MADLTDVFAGTPEVPLRWAGALLTVLGNAYDDTSARYKLLAQLQPNAADRGNTEMEAMEPHVLSEALFGIRALVEVAELLAEEAGNA